MKKQDPERGQTTVWLVAVIVLVAVSSVAIGRVGGASVRSAHDRASTDLVALAAARGGDRAAAEVATANGVRVESIRWIDDTTVVVTVESATGASLTATAVVEVDIGE